MAGDVVKERMEALAWAGKGKSSGPTGRRYWEGTPIFPTPRPDTKTAPVQKQMVGIFSQFQDPRTGTVRLPFIRNSCPSSRIRCVLRAPVAHSGLKGTSP